MFLWPLDRFEMETPLSGEEITRILQAEIDKKSRYLPIPGFDYGYAGSIRDDGFKIVPRLGYRNSFAPVIIGRFRSGENGIRLQITMRQMLPVGCGWGIWMAFVGISLVSSFMSGSLSGLIVSALLALWGLALWCGLFWYEVRKQRKALIQMFDGREVDG